MNSWEARERNSKDKQKPTFFGGRIESYDNSFYRLVEACCKIAEATVKEG